MKKLEQTVPNLRFKGFTDDWEQHKLGEVAKVTMGQSPSSKNYTDNPNDYVLVQGNADLKSNEISPRVWTKEVTKKVHKGEFIMTVRAPVGYLATANMDAVIGRGVAAIDGNKYLYYLLQTKLLDRTWEKLSSGSTFESISSNDIKNLEIKVTETEEEKLIAKLMDTVTYFVTLQQRKLDLLKQLKKGFLQKMFADQDRKQPVLRFKGFHDDWEQRKLGELGEIITGNTPKTSEVENYDKFGIPWITPTDIHGSYTLTSFKRLSNIGEKKAKLAPANSILVTCIASIGKNTLIRQRSAFNQQINALIPINNDSSFLLAASYNWSKRMVNLAGQTSMQIINKNTFSRLNTTVPSLSEQQAIGILFAKLINLITLQQQKLIKYQSIKKSLLQQMFI